MQCGLERVSFAYPAGDASREAPAPVLQDFSLALPETGSVCLFGPSGCGKTTVLRMLAGLEQPQEGRVLGMAARRVAVLFQEDRLLPWCTVAENIALAVPSAPRAQVLRSAEELLAAVGLPGMARRSPDALSGGQRRRVALARALAFGGDVLLLDEPLRELDEETRAGLRTLILREVRGKLLVLVTHDLAEAGLLCERVVRLDGPPLRAV